MTADDTPRKAGPREWIGLGALALATLAVSFDVFVLLLALPHLSASLGAGATQQLWIVDIYGFMVGGFLITAGSLGDRIGRRRLLLIGAAGFGVASVLSAYATDPVMLIAARALLGVAGATLAPSTRALISTMFGDDRQRALAIGIWAGCFTAGASRSRLQGRIGVVADPGQQRVRLLPGHRDGRHARRRRLPRPDRGARRGARRCRHRRP